MISKTRWKELSIKSDVRAYGLRVTKAQQVSEAQTSRDIAKPSGRGLQVLRHRKGRRMIRSMWPEQIGESAVRAEVGRTGARKLGRIRSARPQI
jgi:hypothetical protein